MEKGPTKASRGLNWFDASSASLAFFTATIFVMLFSCSTSFLKPSKIMMSTSFLKFSMISLILYVDVSTFRIVAISCDATLEVMLAPALVCRQVSFPSVSIVKSF